MRRNAVDGPTATRLREVFESFEADDALKVLVLTGAGGQFCAGADLKAMADPRRRNHVEPTGRAAGSDGLTRMHLRKPAIAAIEGHAVAGGLGLCVDVATQRPRGPRRGVRRVLPPLGRAADRRRQPCGCRASSGPAAALDMTS